jgi:hypothetical protein
MLYSGRLFSSAPRRALSSLAFATATMFAGPALAGTYSEIGDAGQSVATAQYTVGTPSLSNIFGGLTSATDADLYVISILNPATFSATTVGSALDTQLFLFTLGGAPVYMNDDDSGGLTTESTLPAGSGFGPTTAGLYLLAVSFFGYDPVNDVSQFLFESGLSTDVRGPASLVQPNSLGGWADSGNTGLRGDYDIQLTGAASAIPEPASALLVALACAAGGVVTGARTRRRKLASATA